MNRVLKFETESKRYKTFWKSCGTKSRLQSIHKDVPVDEIERLVRSFRPSIPAATRFRIHFHCVLDTLDSFVIQKKLDLTIKEFQNFQKNSGTNIQSKSM